MILNKPYGVLTPPASWFHSSGTPATTDRDIYVSRCGGATDLLNFRTSASPLGIQGREGGFN